MSPCKVRESAGEGRGGNRGLSENKAKPTPQTIKRLPTADPDVNFNR